MKKSMRGMFAVAAGCAVLIAGCMMPWTTGPKELHQATLPPVEVLPAPGNAPIRLVKGGELQFCIVGDFAKEAKITGPMRDGQRLTIQRWGRDSRKQAAKRLQDFFQKTTGKRPECYECDDAKVKEFQYVIAVGKCLHTDELGLDPDRLPHEGFYVRTFDKGVVIAGMDGFEIPGVMDNFNWRCGRMVCNGTEHGAVDFAERFMGVRHYGNKDNKTGLDWEVYPKIADLTIPACAYTDHPRQRIRALKGQWRTGTSSSFFGGEAPSPFALIKAHPDRLEDMFYRDKGGRLWCDAKSYGMNFLDFTNLKLADILVEDFREYYRNDSVGSYWGTTWAPSGEYLWIGQCDKGMVMENERTKDIPRAKGDFAMSEVYGRFYKYFGEQCEKAFPGKTVVLMAYSNYLEAPESVGKLPDNVQIMCCLGSPAFARSKHFQKIWKETYGGWNRLTKKRCVPYTYDIGYEEDEVIQQAIRGYFEGDFYKVFKDYIDPSLTYNCMYRGGIPYHYSTYLAARAMWNPECDADAMLDEYFALFYGKAAAKVKEFYYGILDRWINHYLDYEPYPAGDSRKGSIPCPNKKLWNEVTFEQRAAKKLLAIAAEAEKAVDPASDEGKRVKWFLDPFKNQLDDIIAFQNMKHIHLNVEKAKGEIKIDGALDEADWAKLDFPSFRRAYSGGDRPCLTPETKIVWDEKGLYIAIRSPKPYAAGNALWKGDAFEFMLAPMDAEKKVSNLYQFVLDPANFFEDYWKQIEPPRGKEINWCAPNLKHAAKQAGEYWTGEMFVPYSDLAQGEKAKAGDVWKFNLIYNRKDPFEYISLSPTQNNNHRIDLFATMEFQ